MTLKTPLALLLSCTWLQTFSIAAAAERHEGAHEAHEAVQAREAHEAGQAREAHEAHRVLVPRPAPPKFQPHPPGVHPHGPMVRPHAVRVLRPTAARYGAHPWRHWAHQEFTRPIYYWDWAAIHNVTCVAEDSYGDQYPVSEETVTGFGLAHMTEVEDDALDRCYQESNGDQSCYLATCSHF